MPPLILIIDDSRLVRNALSEHCVKFGYCTILADSGEEGLRLLKEKRVDLIITDVLMPGMNGDEVIRQVKSVPSLAAIPILVVSGNADEAMIVSCIELGAEDVLPKPFEPALLRARISAGLERSKLRLLEIRMREEKATERFGKELVGAICHNFNQPLTVAAGDINFSLTLLSHLEKYINYVYEHLTPASRSDCDDCIQQFIVASGRSISHTKLLQDLRETTVSIEKAIKRMSDLVVDVRALNRPAAQSYLDTTKITNFDESKKPVLLIAMRHDAVRAACESCLISSGFRIIAADQETKTTHHAWFSSPHLIIADANQPDMEDILGILRLKSIRELETPLIVLSNSISLEHDEHLAPFASEINAVITRFQTNLPEELRNKCNSLLKNI